MTSGGSFITSEEGWNWCPAVAVDFDNDGFIILSLQANEKRGFEMLNWISKSRPNLIMRFEMKPEIGAKPAGDSCLKICGRCNSGCTTLKESTKMLDQGACHSSKNLVAMESPCESISHVHQWRKSPVIDNGRWIDTVDNGWESRGYG